MVSEEELNKYKAIIQQIIDKHLPKEKRFSVKDFTQEEIWYLSRLFLEKDPKEREKIRKEIDDRQKATHEDFLLYNEEIINQKNRYDTIFNTIDEINSLATDIDLDTELEK